MVSSSLLTPPTLFSPCNYIAGDCPERLGLFVKGLKRGERQVNKLRCPCPRFVEPYYGRISRLAFLLIPAGVLAHFRCRALDVEDIVSYLEGETYGPAVLAERAELFL